MTNSETSSTYKESNQLEQSKNKKFEFVHDLIEILAGSIALIVPAIIFLLWTYRFAVCTFYGLPTFYSSLNIVRFLPVFFIIVLILILVQERTLDTSEFLVVRIKYNLQKDNSDQTDSNDQTDNNEREHNLVLAFNRLLLIISTSLFMIMPILLIFEILRIFAGFPPLLFENGVQSSETNAFITVMLAILITIWGTMSGIKLYKAMADEQKNVSAYFSIKIRKIIFSISILRLSERFLKRLLGVYLANTFFSIIVITGYLGATTSYYKTSYYLLNFDNIQYAVVLDTDDYYIGEPIDIIQQEDSRELNIQTNAYLYLDKAENPVTVRRESFDSVKVFHELRE